MDEESAEPSFRPDPAVNDVDRLEALEHQVRQLTSRLAGWVEAQLVQALEDRRDDMKALRAELQVVVNEQLAGIRAEQASILIVATRRLELAQGQLGERLDAVAARVASAVKPADGEGLHQLDERVSQRLAQLHDAVEARLAAATERQRADLDALRTELRTALSEGPRRTDGLEQRVRAAMSRLSETVEANLSEVTATRQGELDGLRSEMQAALGQQGTELRTEIAHTATALRARFTQAQERVDAMERQYAEAGGRLDQLVESKLSEIVDRRRVELDQLKWEVQEELAKQVSEARGEIGATVSEAHKRFLLSVERLDERLNAVRDGSTSLLERVEAVHEAVSSDGRRIEALEIHTRRTDARLTELVETKLEELAGERAAELEEFHSQLRAASDERMREMAAAMARVEALEASVKDRLWEAGKRLETAVDAKLAELGPVVAEVHDYRSGTAALSEQVPSLAAAAATAKAAFAEAGMLAPLRSDLHQMQQQLAELSEAMAERRPRRKTAAAPGTAPGRVLPAVRSANPPVRTPTAAPKVAKPAATATKASKASKAGKATKAAKAAKAAKAVPRSRRSQ